MTPSKRVGLAAGSVLPLALFVVTGGLAQVPNSALQTNGGTDLSLQHVLAKTASTGTISTGVSTITVSLNTVGALTPGLNLILGRETSAEEVLTSFTPSGMPTGTCSSGAMPPSGQWCLETDAADTLIMNATQTHTGSTNIEQLGSTILQSYDLVVNSKALNPTGLTYSAPLRVKDATNVGARDNGNPIAYIPSDITTTWPFSAVQLAAILTGTNGANKDLVIRNNTASSTLKVNSADATTTLLALTESSDTATLTLGGKLTINNTPTASTTITSAPSASRTWTFQDATDTVVGLSTTDTLTNKTLTSPTATGATTVQASTSLQVPLTVKGAASQTGDLEDWDDPSGTVLAKITHAGAAQFAFDNLGTRSSGIAFDAGMGNTFKVTLTASVTTGNSLANATAGQVLNFLICQDPHGGHSFTWPSNFKGAGTISSGSGTTTASTCDVQNFVYDGTSAYALGPLQSNL